MTLTIPVDQATRAGSFLVMCGVVSLAFPLDVAGACIAAAVAANHVGVTMCRAVEDVVKAVRRARGWSRARALA